MLIATADAEDFDRLSFLAERSGLAAVWAQTCSDVTDYFMACRFDKAIFSAELLATGYLLASAMRCRSQEQGFGVLAVYVGRGQQRPNLPQAMGGAPVDVVLAEPVDARLFYTVFAAAPILPPRQLQRRRRHGYLYGAVDPAPTAFADSGENLLIV